MPVEEALEHADEWIEGVSLYEGAQGWRVACATLAAEVRRLRYHLTELGKAADAAAMVIATIEAEDTTEEENLQAVMDAIWTWAPAAIMGTNAIGQGSAACGASPAPTGYASGKRDGDS